MAVNSPLLHADYDGDGLVTVRVEAWKLATGAVARRRAYSRREETDAEGNGQGTSRPGSRVRPDRPT